MLNYLGYNVDKLTMADYYLDKGKMGEVSPYKAFVGNPRDEDSCGAFAPVLVNSATKYLKIAKIIYECIQYNGSIVQRAS